MREVDMHAAYPQPAVVSLFCGAGGLDLGFRRGGFRPVVALDKSESCITTYRANHSGCASWAEDLTAAGDQLAERIEHSVWEALGDDGVGWQPIGIIGGPPCQGFSRANVARDDDDPRNKLIFSYVSLLKQLRRRLRACFFVFENVVGIRHKRNKKHLKKLHAQLAEAGFEVFETVLDAYDYGVPQHRQRLFLVGWDTSFGGVDFEFPKPTRSGGTLRRALAGLPDPIFFRRGLDAEDIPFHENHWTMQPRSKRFEMKDFNRYRSFRRLDWDEPSPTVAYGNREIHVHPEGERRLSILEAMRLQGFPDSYCLKGNLSQQVTQVSNAVPPPLAEALASAVMRTLTGISTELQQSARGVAHHEKRVA